MISNLCATPVSSGASSLNVRTTWSVFPYSLFCLQYSARDCSCQSFICWLVDERVRILLLDFSQVIVCVCVWSSKSGVDILLLSAGLTVVLSGCYNSVVSLHQYPCLCDLIVLIFTRFVVVVIIIIIIINYFHINSKKAGFLCSSRLIS